MTLKAEPQIPAASNVIAYGQVGARPELRTQDLENAYLSHG